MSGSSVENINKNKSKISIVNIITVLIIIVLIVYYDLINSIQTNINFSINLMPNESTNNRCSKTTYKPSQLLTIYGSNSIEQFSWKEIDQSKDNIVNQLFNLAMLHLYGFNKVEASRILNAALSVNKNCIKCYWALAYANGPDINADLHKQELILANDFLNKAHNLILLHNCSDYLLDLFQAQRSRFAVDVNNWDVKSQKLYDEKYSKNMENLLIKYPNDSNILSLYAESVMNIYPWKYYNSSSNELFPWLNPAVISLRKALLHSNYKNPFALHLYIHLTESSSNPSIGTKAADALFKLTGNDGSSHLNHMPAHLFIRIGRYQSAIDSSINSVTLDNHYNSKCLTSYLPNHNQALLVMSAMSIGKLNLALQYTETVSDTNDAASLYLSGLFPTSKELVLSRFGQWDSILSIHNHYTNLSKLKRNLRTTKIDTLNNKPIYLQVIHQYAVTLSHIRLAHNDFINSSVDLLSKLVTDIPPDSIPLDHQFYPYHQELGSIMNLTAFAAYFLSENQINHAIELLENAAKIQLSFKYMEPENHYLPIRQCLAALYLQRNDIDKAIDIYADDLVEHPSNGWSLKGLIVSKNIYKNVNQGLNSSVNQIGNSCADSIYTNNFVHSKSEWINCSIDQLEKLFDFIWSGNRIRGSCCELGFC